MDHKYVTARKAGNCYWPGQVQYVVGITGDLSQDIDYGWFDTLLSQCVSCLYCVCSGVRSTGVECRVSHHGPSARWQLRFQHLLSANSLQVAFSALHGMTRVESIAMYSFTKGQLSHTATNGCLMAVPCAIQKSSLARSTPCTSLPIIVWGSKMTWFIICIEIILVFVSRGIEIDLFLE